MNESVKAWVRHEKSRRIQNCFYILLAVLCIFFAATVSTGGLLLLPFVGMSAGMSNVCMLLSRPRLEATDEDIRAASEVGPRWFSRLIDKLDSQP
jgi:hypothetical protein